MTIEWSWIVLVQKLVMLNCCICDRAPQYLPTLGSRSLARWSPYLLLFLLTLLSSSLSLSLLPLSLSSPARWSPYWGMHSSRASATSQLIGDLEMMTSLALDPSRLRRRRPSLVTASQSRLLTQQVLDGKPQPRFCDHTFVFFLSTYFLFRGTSYLRWNTFACLQIVAEVDTRSRIEGQLWISFCKSFQCNVMIWFNIFLLKVRISATTPVGDLEAEVAVHKENFIHGFSLHQVPNYLLYLFLTCILRKPKMNYGSKTQ